MVAGPGQQPDRPATDDQVGLRMLQADLAGLLQGCMVVLGQPRQAGDRKVVVAFLNGEGNGSLD